MIREIRKRIKNQKGFTLVELIVVIVILGILAAIAIPRLSDSTTRANTGKIVADLRTLDSAVSMKQADDGGNVTTDIGTLFPNYVAAAPKKPTGNCYIDGANSPVPTDDYSIKDGRAHLGDYTSENFHK